MKIGIYGGTFDPIHCGHVYIARTIKRELGLDSVFFVVTADPPHKPDHMRTPGWIRFEMVQAALKDEYGMYASDIELQRGGISYTVDTLRTFKQLYSRADLYFIVGADMLENFPHWYCPDEIMRLTILAAAHRPNECADIVSYAKRIESSFGGRVIVTDVHGPDVSSSIVREMVYNAMPISELVPPDVEKLIYRNLLYMPSELRNIGASLARELDEYRFYHTTLVACEAISLAYRHGIDTKKARLAGLLHDCAKQSNSNMVEYALSHGFTPTEEELCNPFLIHARIGAEIAKNVYGVKDEEILNAIRRHTLGCPEMTVLDKVIYIADKIEPSRSYRKLNELRELAYKDLDTATVAIMCHSLSYNEAHGNSIHLMTRLAIEAIKGKMANKAQDNGAKTS